MYWDCYCLKKMCWEDYGAKSLFWIQMKNKKRIYVNSSNSVDINTDPLRYIIRLQFKICISFS